MKKNQYFLSILFVGVVMGSRLFGQTVFTDDFSGSAASTTTVGASLGTSGWKNLAGTDSKEYNVAGSGVLELRYLNAASTFESVSRDFTSQSLSTVGDNLSLSFRFQVFGDSGSVQNNSAGFRVQLLDGTNGGYGINIATGTTTANNFVTVASNLGTTNIAAGGLTFNSDESGFTNVTFTLTKEASGVRLTGSIGGTSFTNTPLDASYTSFSRLNFSTHNNAHAARIDDVTLTASLAAVPEPNSSAVFAFGFLLLGLCLKRLNRCAR